MEFVKFMLLLKAGAVTQTFMLLLFNDTFEQQEAIQTKAWNQIPLTKNWPLHHAWQCKYY